MDDLKVEVQEQIEDFIQTAEELHNKTLERQAHLTKIKEQYNKLVK